MTYILQSLDPGDIAPFSLDQLINQSW